MLIARVLAPVLAVSVALGAVVVEREKPRGETRWAKPLPRASLRLMRTAHPRESALGNAPAACHTR